MSSADWQILKWDDSHRESSRHLPLGFPTWWGGEGCTRGPVHAPQALINTSSNMQSLGTISDTLVKTSLPPSTHWHHHTCSQQPPYNPHLVDTQRNVPDTFWRYLYPHHLLPGGVSPPPPRQASHQGGHKTTIIPSFLLITAGPQLLPSCVSASNQQHFSKSPWLTMPWTTFPLSGP